MKAYIDGKVALKILLNYFRDGVDVPWDNSYRIEKLVKKYINGGFDDGFIGAATIEGENILNSICFPKEWVKKEIGDFTLKKDDLTYREFLELLLKTLKRQFMLFKRRRDNYYFKDIFIISQETKEFYNNKYKELSCLTQYFKYYYDDVDSIKKLMFEKEHSEVAKIKDALENILQEKPFPYKWLANSLQRKVVDMKGANVDEKYYNWTVEILIVFKNSYFQVR